MPRAGLEKKIIKDARGVRRTYWVRKGLPQLKRLTQAKEKARVDDHEAREEHLEAGTVSNIRTTGVISMNTTKRGVVTHEGKAVEALIKTGQRADALNREVMSSKVLHLFGVESSPTVIRTVGGRIALVQEWKLNTLPSDHDDVDPRKVDRHILEKMRVFDVVAANPDRHGGNLLLRKEGDKFIPLPIDHEMAFSAHPTTRQYLAQPVGLTQWHEGPLLPETKKMIAAIRPEVLAKTLHKAGGNEDQIYLALTRLAIVKKRPDDLAQGDMETVSGFKQRLADLCRAGAPESILTPAEILEARNLSQDPEGPNPRKKPLWLARISPPSPTPPPAPPPPPRGNTLNPNKPVKKGGRPSTLKRKL